MQKHKRHFHLTWTEKAVLAGAMMFGACMMTEDCDSGSQSQRVDQVTSDIPAVVQPYEG